MSGTGHHRTLAVADTLVLLAAVPLYVVPPVYPFTGRLASYYNTYMSLLPVLWPVYLMLDKCRLVQFSNIRSEVSGNDS